MAVHLVGGAAPSAEMFTDLFRLGFRFELTIPAEVGTVLRALATMEGTLTLVEPGFDLVVEARQYAAAHVTGQLSPRAVQKTAADELMALLPGAAPAAAPGRPHHRRHGTRQVQRQRAAVRR